MRICQSIQTLTLLALLGLSQPAVAADLQQTIHLYGAQVTYPAPSWLTYETDADAKSVLDQSETYRSEDRDQFILEQIPKGQHFSDWSQLYAVNAVRIAEAVNFSLEGFVNGSFAPFIQYCGRPNFKMQPIKHDAETIVALIFCQNSPRAKDGTGYGDGIGEIALFHFQKVGQTYVKVYQEWKGKAFKLEERDGWPVSVETIKMMAARFETITITPREK